MSAAGPALMPQQRYLSRRAAAEYAGLSVASIDRLLAERRLTRLHPIPGRTLIDREQLDSCMQMSAEPARS